MSHVSRDPSEQAEKNNPMNAHDWYVWLGGKQASKFEESRSRPNRLVSDFNGEKTFIREYEGREILELLQNANDAAAKAGIEGKARFELRPDGLIAANKGCTFSTDGVGSLFLPHTSPKPAEGAQMIGNKGLGFRSVLNWTRCPIILSGQLSIAFSDQVAIRRQAELALLSEDLRACIERHQRSGEDLVVPLLAFPGFSADSDLTAFVDGDPQRGIYERCRELQSDGYNTVIGMPFAEPSITAIASKQMELLRPEVLLFAPHLNELEVSVEGEPLRRWRREAITSDILRVYIGLSDSDYREWTIYSRRGRVPPKLLTPDQQPETDYGIVIAIASEQEASTGYLFSYFPTEVRFPFPMVCHVTLDLHANRQQPQNTQANQFILGELADFMAATAEKIAGKVTTAAGLKLIAGEPYASDNLEKFNFRSRLLDAARKRSIIPTISGRLANAGEARRVPFTDTSWLPTSRFGNVVNLPDDAKLQAVMGQLGIPFLSDAEWEAASADLDFATIAERADFIAGIVRYDRAARLAESLLLDAEGNPVPKGYRIFLSAPDQSMLSSPHWFKARFLHSGLKESLMRRLEVGDQDSLASKLSRFGIIRYSLDNLLGALAVRANHTAESEPHRANEIRAELIRAFWQLFPKDVKQEERPRFPKDAPVLLLTKTGAYETPRTLYLGSGYGSRGEILEELFRPIGLNRIIAPPEKLGLPNVSHLADFFVWLGVGDLPRELRTDSPEPGFRAHVVQSLVFPLQMEDYHFSNQGEMGESHFRNVATLDGLESFLNKADPVAVLSWLAIDDRAVRWKSLSNEHGAFGIRLAGDHRARFFDGALPSYVRWRLENVQWLPTRDGQLRSPRHCLTESIRGLEELLPVPRRPSREQLSIFGVSSAFVRDAFDRAGVNPGFSQLDPDQLYELLLALPSRDLNGAAAKSVYRAILDHFEAGQVSRSSSRDRFIQHGRMWARHGSSEAYWPVTELWHIDSEDIPTTLSQELKVVALPKRSGTQKVQALFGVKAVERQNVIRRISYACPVAEAAAFADEIEHLKPLVLALRRSQSQRSRESVEFKEVKIVVCSSVEGDVEFEGQKQPLELSAWNWIMEDDTHTAYILCDPAERNLMGSDLLADTVGQIFAAIFRIERGDEFARLVACKRKDRFEILRRLVGDEEIPDREELERRYRDVTAATPSDDITLPETSLERDHASPPPNPPTEPVGPAEPPSLAEKEDDPLQINRKVHTPAPPAGRVPIRVSRKVPATKRHLSGARRVTDGAFCEQKALEFEAHYEPMRYPVLVSNVTGWKAPGVDILSFDSAGDRGTFLAGNHSEALVARFIEVKGRSSEGAKIDLRDNALAAARKYKAKYFLYRLFDRGDGTYEMACLRDPINDNTAARVFYEINLETATGTEPFDITGGLSETTYRISLNPGEAPIA